MQTRGYAATSATSPLAPFAFERRTPGDRDVHVTIDFCGICHSDIHSAKNEWQGTEYPFVPGHEIIGRVVKAGKDVTRFREGQRVGVGCFVNSCRTCPECKAGHENYCQVGMIMTYGGVENGTPTRGGYSRDIVVDEHFVFAIPDGLDPAGAAPLLCAGITTYSPLRHWGIKKGKKVGVVGLGGLGHMGVKFAHAFGAHVVLFTTSPGKAADARRLGADEVVVSKDAAEMQKHASSFDFILDCVSAVHDLNAYLALLKVDGTLTLVGAPPQPVPISAFNLIFGRRSLAGSAIGGIRETQEMLDFCGEHGITADVETIRVQQINEAYERLLKGDVKYRFSIDMASLKS